MPFCSYVERKKNSTRRILASANGNPVDDCWRSDSNWHNDRQALADCAIGFGKNAAGGKEGRVYVVTDDSDDNVVNPKEGTLRYGVLQEEPLWIVFDRNMKIKLKNELILTSYKTIDGRGANVHLSDGAGLKIQFVQNIIVHGIHFHNIVPTGPAVIRSSPTHVGHRDKTDGTAIAIFTSHDVWVDHCFFSKADDGLVDAIRGSTRITVSNCYFSNHDKVRSIDSLFLHCLLLVHSTLFSTLFVFSLFEGQLNERGRKQSCVHWVMVTGYVVWSTQARH